MDATTELINLTVNGEALSFPAGLTVAGLVTALALDIRKVAVELNREIVPRSTYAQVALSSGDTLEIVHFIGGG
jgi:thiamine biosynthesis protein ThiS